MKKLLSLLLMILVLCGCKQREDFYVFSFDDFTIAPGYDDVEYLRLIFDLDLPETMEADEVLTNQEVYFWDDFFASIDIKNDSRKPISIDKGKISRLIFYLANYPASSYKISGVELSESVKENCDSFGGEYIERNGYACAFGKKSEDKNNIVVLYGDIFGIDQDRLDHIEIYVE